MSAPVVPEVEERPPEVVQIDDLFVEIKNNKVRVGQTYFHLRRREFQILAILALAHVACPEEPISQYFILGVWYPQGDWPDSTVVHAHISYLRKRLREECGGKNYIQNIWGKGYRLSPDCSYN